MAAVEITFDDLSPFAPTLVEGKAQLMIDDAIATAAVVAPCILDEDFTAGAAAKAIIRGALVRWAEAGSGAVVTQAAGPFSQALDTRQVRRAMFYPSEITDLQRLCRTIGRGRAFTIDTIPAVTE
ncbi:hypothetical protein [Rhodococcus jostii]|uniref:hypothetical protein n=1 Tax=Rhodococcus jostii TaxID=132919 RepID=UPI003642F793